MSLSIGNRILFSRGPRLESACGTLRDLSPRQQSRVAGLRNKYGIVFESLLNQETSLNNYAYLDLLDRAWAAAAGQAPRGSAMADVGCASFWYVAALHAFFAPRRLIGHELDAYRRYGSGHSRRDHAQGYASAWPATAFNAQDYLLVAEPADLITCWFPFLTAVPVLAWGLPLNLLKQKELMSRIGANLTTGGGFFMVNHGVVEAHIAAQVCESVGLRRRWTWTEHEPLRSRAHPPVASYWQH